MEQLLGVAFDKRARRAALRTAQSLDAAIAAQEAEIAAPARADTQAADAQSESEGAEGIRARARYTRMYWEMVSEAGDADLESVVPRQLEQGREEVARAREALRAAKDAPSVLLGVPESEVLAHLTPAELEAVRELPDEQKARHPRMRAKTVVKPSGSAAENRPTIKCVDILLPRRAAGADGRTQVHGRRWQVRRPRPRGEADQAGAARQGAPPGLVVSFAFYCYATCLCLMHSITRTTMRSLPLVSGLKQGSCKYLILPGSTASLLLSGMRSHLFRLLCCYASLSSPSSLGLPADLSFPAAHAFFLSLLDDPHLVAYPPAPEFQRTWWKWALAQLEELLQTSTTDAEEEEVRICNCMCTGGRD
jgi:hypothetical protein